MKKALTAILMCAAIQSSAFEKGDGRICLHDYHTGRTLETAYRNGGRYDEKALASINDIFKSRSDGKIIDIDKDLIELLDNIQDHFKANCLELISGYRSPELNRALKKRGAQVGEESMHLEGMAADIHIDEVTEEAVRDYALSLGAGGVGYYPSLDFVHIDTGEVRKWSLPDRPGRLLTAFTKGPEWQVMTDKNIYIPGENVRIEIMNITRSERVLNDRLVLQRYSRGKWIDVKGMYPCGGERIGPGKSCNAELAPDEKTPFGKYRLTIPKEGFPHLSSMSNEFYLKRL